ncbi:MAG: hypothetical protein WC360_01915 [Opitutales bacterium]|jgi:hypothetical protein
MKKTILTVIGALAACGTLAAQTAVPNKISEDLTLHAGTDYLLNGYTYVLDGATLTIEPGVHVYANEDTGVNASALIITRGGKIMAQGSPTAPIIFEPISAKDVDLGPDDTGMWGGVIVLGKGKLNSNALGVWTGYPTQDIEGMVPATEDLPLINFGGEDNADNSGVLSYISIRNGGISLSEGNEINGLTLGGVGSGTTINHIEVFANKDDAVEIFGGAVNLDHIVAAFSYDDSLDLDEGYLGHVQYYFVIQRKGAGTNTDKGDKGGEWDGNDLPNTATPLMLVKLANATFVGMGTESSNTAFNIRHNGAGQVYNSIFVEYDKMIQLDEDSDGACLARYNNGDDIFSGNIWFSSTPANNDATALAVSGSGLVSPMNTFFSGTNQIANPGLAISRVAGAYALDVTPADDSVAVTSEAATVPTELEQTSFKGAFDPYYNWAIGWTKLYSDGYFVVEGSWFDHPKWGWIYLNSGTLDDGSYVYFKNTDQWMWVAASDSTGFWSYVFD